MGIGTWDSATALDKQLVVAFQHRYGVGIPIPLQELIDADFAGHVVENGG